MIRLWTDGACSYRGQRIGGWGFIAERDGAILVEHAGRDRPATSNRMELLAVIAAARWHKLRFPAERARIITDSKYVHHGLRFPERGYNPDRDHHRNGDLWDELEMVLGTDVRPDWKLVPGHNGIRFNELADALAKRGQRDGTIFRAP